MTPARHKRRSTPQTYSQGRSHAANIGKRGLYHCNYCQKDITGVVRIKCAVCQDFDLCLDCFSVGVEIDPHKNHHAYRVMDSLAFPLFHPDWGADEEQLLLEAIDMAGFGNWAAVADHVGTKSKEECQGHYFDIYVNSARFPLPFPVPQMANIDPLEYQKAKQAKQAQDRQQQLQGAASAAERSTKDHSMAREESLAAESGVRQANPVAQATAASTDAETARPNKKAKVEPQESTVHHNQAEARSSLSPAADTVPGHAQEAQGDNEQPVIKHPNRAGQHQAGGDMGVPGVGPSAKDLQEGEAGESTPNLEGSSRVPAGHMDHGLPAEGLRMHTEPGVLEKVSGRGVGRGSNNAANSHQALNKKAAHEVIALAGFHIKRQEFEPEYDNEAEMIVADMEFNDDDTEEDIQEKVRIIEIYNTRLAERERRRKFVMDRKLVNIRKQQNLDRRRTPSERALHARLKGIARYLPQPEFDVLSEGMVMEQRLRTRIQELKELRRAGIRTFADAELYEADKKRKSTLQPSGSNLGPGSLPRDWQYPSATPVDQGALTPRLVTASTLPLANKRLSGLPVEAGQKAAAALAGWRARRGVALDITALPGMDLLSSKERELCAQARLLPVHYLELKALMMREGQTKGYISRQEARNFFRLEPSKAVRVYDLLMAAGWLPAAIGNPNATNSSMPVIVGMES